MGDTKLRGKLDVGGVTGPLWAIGWLFTIGYTGLSTGKAVLAIVLWPYYLGSVLSSLPPASPPVP